MTAFVVDFYDGRKDDNNAELHMTERYYYVAKASIKLAPSFLPYLSSIAHPSGWWLVVLVTAKNDADGNELRTRRAKIIVVHIVRACWKLRQSGSHYRLYKGN